MAPSSPNQIGELLVLVLGEDATLRSWLRNGIIERETALYDRLFARGCYDRMVVVSRGTEEAPAPFERFCELIPKAPRGSIHLVSPREGEDPKVFSFEVAPRVLAVAGNARTAVVKTDQMENGSMAALVSSRLTHAGVHTALIARGGEHTSKKKTIEQGPSSAAAVAAGLQEDRVCRRADLIVGTTRRMIEDLCWRHSIPMERARVVPNYVVRGPDPDPQELRDRSTLLVVGPLIAPRRTDLVIRAMVHGPAEEGGRLAVIGTGPEERSLRELVVELGLQDAVTFEPRLEHTELSRRMYDSSMYVQASCYEGHPKTLIEAMYRGMACVVTRSPGLSDTVQHGVLGLVAEPKPDAMGLAIAELMRDDDWRGVLAAGAARHSAQIWGIDRVIEQEIEAHRVALEVGATRSNREYLPEVLWDKMLLDVDPRSAADVWARAIGEFTLRSNSNDQAKFAMHLGDAIDAWRTTHLEWDGHSRGSVSLFGLGLMHTDDDTAAA